ncbi:MAG: hypothetical protein AB1538_10635 [Bacillota bacterium]
MIKEIGEDMCKQLFANFSCPLDPDIEYFLKEKAILFENLDISRTYLVYASYQDENILVGYFAIASKTLTIRSDISKTLRKKLTGFKIKHIKTIPVYLIGQLAKNYASNLKKLNLISGEELLRLAFKKIIEAQSVAGGRIILVECADKPKLRDFYEKYGFKIYSQDNEDGLLRYIREIRGITVL